MQEKLFNLFLFVTDDVIREIGAVRHKHSGTDAEKLAFLQSQVATDFPIAKRYSVPNRYVLVQPKGIRKRGALRYQSYVQLAAIGKQIEFFEEIFEELEAPHNPLMCITPIVDGQLRVDGIDKLS